MNHQQQQIRRGLDERSTIDPRVIVDLMAMDLAVRSAHERDARMEQFGALYFDCFTRWKPEADDAEILANMTSMVATVYARVAQMDLSAGIVGNA